MTILVRLYYLGPDSIAWSGTSIGTFSVASTFNYLEQLHQGSSSCVSSCDVGMDLNTSEFVCERMHAMLKLQKTSAGNATLLSRILTICLEIRDC